MRSNTLKYSVKNIFSTRISWYNRVEQFFPKSNVKKYFKKNQISGQQKNLLISWFLKYYPK